MSNVTITLPATLQDSGDGKHNLTDFQNYIIDLDINNDIAGIYYCSDGILLDNKKHVTTDECGKINLNNATFGDIDISYCIPYPEDDYDCYCNPKNPSLVDIENPMIRIMQTDSDKSFVITTIDSEDNTLQTLTYSSSANVDAIYSLGGLLYTQI